jgi:hypothetical protein
MCLAPVKSSKENVSGVEKNKNNTTREQLQ